MTGKLGTGNIESKAVMTQIGSDSNWSSVFASSYSSFAIKTTGSLWVWGYNGRGNLGIGSTVNRSSPVQVGTGTDWSAV